MSGYVRLDAAAIDELLQSPDGPIGVDLLKKAVQVETAAKRFCPVDTGRLRSSITHELGTDARGLAARVGTNVEYAPYVELGTARMAPRGFLRRGLAQGLSR